MPAERETGPRRGRLLTTEPPAPDRIIEIGLGFWGAKTLLSAVELGLFTQLAEGPLDAEALRARLGLHPRSARDFFDALVALGVLDREGDRYANTPETALFLDPAKPTYIGGFLEMVNARLYPFWGGLTDGLRTRTSRAAASTCRKSNPFSPTTWPSSGSRTGSASTQATSSATRCRPPRCW